MTRRFLAIAIFVLLAAGCSRGPRRLPVFPVEGVITHQGKPATGAIVIFNPEATTSLLSEARPRGKAGADGVFKLTTYEKDDGAPAGDYVVTIYWPQPRSTEGPDLDDGPDRLKGRYADPKLPLKRISVSPEAQQYVITIP